MSVAIRSILIGFAAWCGIAIVCAVMTGTLARRSVWVDYWIMSSPLTVALAMLFACREERRIVRLFGNRSKGWLGACCFLILVLSGIVYFFALVIVMMVLEAL